MRPWYCTPCLISHTVEQIFLSGQLPTLPSHTLEMRLSHGSYSLGIKEWWSGSVVYYCTINPLWPEKAWRNHDCTWASQVHVSFKTQILGRALLKEMWYTVRASALLVGVAERSSLAVWYYSLVTRKNFIGEQGDVYTSCPGMPAHHINGHHPRFHLLGHYQVSCPVFTEKPNGEPNVFLTWAVGLRLLS